jgi:hypothetical protein
LNLKLREPEAGDVTDTSVGETDEWRWTVEHFNAFNHLPGLGCNGERAQERGHGNNQSRFHATFFFGEHGKSQTIQE